MQKDGPVSVYDGIFCDSIILLTNQQDINVAMGWGRGGFVPQHDIICKNDSLSLKNTADEVVQ